MDIAVFARTLSDRSIAYDVVIATELILPAVSKDDANLLATKLSEAIEAHTNETVRLIGVD